MTSLTGNQLVDRYLIGSTECPICVDELRDPKYLPCNHTFCLRCLQCLCGGRRRGICPVCRSPFDVPRGNCANLPDDFRMKECLEIMARALETETAAAELTASAQQQLELSRSVSAVRSGQQKPRPPELSHVDPEWWYAVTAAIDSTEVRSVVAQHDAHVPEVETAPEATSPAAEAATNRLQSDVHSTQNSTHLPETANNSSNSKTDGELHMLPEWVSQIGLGVVSCVAGYLIAFYLFA